MREPNPPHTGQKNYFLVVTLEKFKNKRNLNQEIVKNGWTIMDCSELKKEQLKLASRIIVYDGFTTIKTIAGATCLNFQNKILASIVVLEYPSFTLLEKKTYWLSDPIPYRPGFQAYREMPALLEAYNLLETEPDILLVSGAGRAHPRKIGLASHLGLALNLPTIGITEKLVFGRVEQGKIYINHEICGFEVRTREHANPVYVSPGHLVALDSALEVVSKTILYPHKLPEPLHAAHKLGRKMLKEKEETNTILTEDKLKERVEKVGLKEMTPLQETSNLN